MVRVLQLIRLPLTLLLTLVLGYLVFHHPTGFTKVVFKEGGSIAVPDTIEGWSLETGEGDLLVRGHSRLNQVSLEIVKTHVPVGSDLRKYVDDRHFTLDRELSEYQPRLRGELKRWGSKITAPIGRAAFKADWHGMNTEHIVHDVYLPHHGEFVRVSYTYPSFIYDLISIDEAILMTSTQLEP